MECDIIPILFHLQALEVTVQLFLHLIDFHVTASQFSLTVHTPLALSLVVNLKMKLRFGKNHKTRSL